MSGDAGGYTEDEINRVVKAAAGRFRACYQKELNRTPGIGGKIVVRFKIGPDGGVQSAAPTGGSSLSNEAVQSCVARNVQMLRFPPKGAIANVTYPFVFSPGG
jgi:outer membrane biosynthesis protein TonB